jgi:hypothetical protein
MDIVEKLERDRPAFHWGGTRRWDTAPETLREIRNRVSEGMRTLETGCGASTVVFAASGAQHTVISPTSDEHDRVRSYLDENGIDSSRVTFEADFSDDLLPKLFTNPDRMSEWRAWCDEHFGSPNEVAVEELFRATNRRHLDLVFLDGAHAFPYPVVDWHYSMNVLKIGGRMIVDDIPIPAVACVYEYMVSDPSWKLVGIHDNRAASFELVAEPAPEDWTLQPYNRHPYFGFESPPKRVYHRGASELGRLRRNLGERLPGLRERWRRWSRH